MIVELDDSTPELLKELINKLLHSLIRLAIYIVILERYSLYYKCPNAASSNIYFKHLKTLMIIS